MDIRVKSHQIVGEIFTIVCPHKKMNFCHSQGLLSQPLYWKYILIAFIGFLSENAVKLYAPCYTLDEIIIKMF